MKIWDSKKHEKEKIELVQRIKMVNVIIVRQIHLLVRVENLLYKLMRVMRRVEQQFGIVKV
jgi:CelD/BcsL family acetyltransferase involved in cellulose biosynthesis